MLCPFSSRALSRCFILKPYKNADLYYVVIDALHRGSKIIAAAQALPNKCSRIITQDGCQSLEVLKRLPKKRRRDDRCQTKRKPLAATAANVMERR